MKEPILGKVARVLSVREIVINVGSEKGVNVGMHFDVMGHVDISDPDSDEVIGSLERSKVRVLVTDAQDKLSVATTYRKRTVNTFGLFGRALMPAEWTAEYETLNAGEATWQDSSSVKTGDPVVQVLEEHVVEQENVNS